MASLGDAILFLKTKNDGLKQGLDEGEKQVSGWGGRLGGVMTGISQGIGQAAFGLVQRGAGAAVGFITESIAAASDLNETVSKIGVVFGDSAEDMLKWGENSATALGMSKNAALGAAGTYGNLFVSMGFAKDEAADMSKGLVELAADLASFNNMDPTVVLEKLRAGLTGETEPLKELGVNLSAAAVEAKALSMGLAQADVDMTKVNGATIALSEAQAKAAEVLQKYGAESKEYEKAQQKVAEAEDKLAKAMGGSKVELTAAAKAQATYALILEQTKTAQGDFARTSEGLANQQRIQKAEWEDLKAAMGDAFLPVQLEVTKALNELLQTVLPPLADLIKNDVVPAVQSIVDWFKNLSPETQSTALWVLGLTAAFLAAVPAITAVVTVVGLLLNPIGAVLAVIGLLAVAWSQNWLGIREQTANAIALIQGNFDVFKTSIGQIWESLKEFWTWLTNLASGTMELAISAPAWITALVLWTWPVLFGAPAWITALTAWLWPAFIDEPGWVEALRRWLWPKIEDEPSWVGDLVDWIWPEFPSRPQWLQDLLNWAWPSLPGPLARLLGGGGNETVAGSSVATGYSLSSRAGSLVGGGPRLRLPAAAAGGVVINIYQTNTIRNDVDTYRAGRKMAEEVARRVR